MSEISDQMELREADILAQYDAALALLDGFDYAPRLARAAAAASVERSSGIRTRRAFRSTSPGLTMRRVTRSSGVDLRDRIGSVGDEALMAPMQAQVLQSLHRALATAPALSQ